MSGKILCSSPIQSKASGKAIFLGEHSVVYGHSAVATSLPDMCLHLTITPPAADRRNMPQRWSQAWRFLVNGKTIEVKPDVATQLQEALSLALQNHSLSLQDLAPHRLDIESSVPLGAGMGGSAALAVALVRALAAAHGEHLSTEVTAQRAHPIDGVFHTSASGVDVATIVLGGVIRYRKGSSPQPVTIARQFWLALVDSGTRARTADMVTQVRLLRAEQPERVNATLSGLGRDADCGWEAIERGDLATLGRHMDNAHELLCSLGLSTPALDGLCELLRINGSLGTKITGSGGGGLAMGLFAEDPSIFLATAFPHNQTWVTRLDEGRPLD